METSLIIIICVLLLIGIVKLLNISAFIVYDSNTVVNKKRLTIQEQDAEDEFQAVNIVKPNPKGIHC
jgi:hypothetical protein